MFYLALAVAYAITIFSLFASVHIVAFGVKTRAIIPTLGGVIYFASAVALIGVLAGV